ncbi:hypothetical protein EJB05_37154, partial [Eragrostis curvula]
MECLFHHFGKQGYLNCEIVNAYITLLRAVQHLATPTMQHNGDEKVIMEEMYPDARSRKRTFLNKRIKSYLNSDMLVGLQKQIEFVMKSRRLPNHKWKDLKVA